MMCCWEQRNGKRGTDGPPELLLGPKNERQKIVIKNGSSCGKETATFGMDPHSRGFALY